MTLTVWHHFLATENAENCEAYLRFHLRYRGEARLTQVCERYMRASEHRACSLSVTEGRVRVDRPPAWTQRLARDRGNGNGRVGPESVEFARPSR